MLTKVVYLYSVLTIAAALRNGSTVYANLVDRPGKQKITDVRAIYASSNVEVFTVYGWNPAVRVWVEIGAEPEPEAQAAAA
jgi:hypothetical protein